MLRLIVLGIPLLAVFAGVGLAWVIGSAGMLAFFASGQEAYIAALPRRIFSSLDVFALMAMPLFILVGELMNRGGITHSLIQFSTLIVGRTRGGLGHVNIATSLFFAGISGSALADAAALSTSLTPAMREKGYTAAYAGAITAASSMIGPILPPSIILIFYGAIMGVDVAALFAASVVPALLLAGALFAANTYYAHRDDHPAETERPPLKRTVGQAAPALLLPLIILMGIVFGVVTPTEAGALAVLASLAVALVLGSLNTDMLKQSFARATQLTGAIFSLLVAGAIVNFLAALVGLPGMVSSWTAELGLGLGGYLVLILTVFLACGMVLDTQIALVLVAPVLAPAAYHLGADPVHLGVILCMTITLGMITPPLGGAVLIVASVTGASYTDLLKATLPFVLIEATVVVMLAFSPGLVLALPHALGLA